MIAIRMSVLVTILMAAGCNGPATPSASGVPVLISPAPNAVVDNGCFDVRDTMQWDFDWENVPGASQYHLQVIARDVQVFTIDNDRLISSSYSDRSGGYVLDQYRLGWRWRVRAQIGGVWGEFSPYRTFDVEPLDTDCTRR